MLGDTRVVLDAQAAHVQLGMTGFAFIEPAQRQRQLFERRTAFPAFESVCHVKKGTDLFIARWVPGGVEFTANK